jgi:hypothetical protein
MILPFSLRQFPDLLANWCFITLSLSVASGVVFVEVVLDLGKVPSTSFNVLLK